MDLTSSSKFASQASRAEDKLQPFKESYDAATDPLLSALEPVALASSSYGRKEFTGSGNISGTVTSHLLSGMELTQDAEYLHGALMFKSEKEDLNKERNVGLDASCMLKQVALPLDNSQGHSDNGGTAEIRLCDSCQVDASTVFKLATGGTSRAASIVSEVETGQKDLKSTPALNQGNNIGDCSLNGKSGLGVWADCTFMTASSTIVDQVMTTTKNSGVVITPAAITGIFTAFCKHRYSKWFDSEI